MHSNATNQPKSTIELGYMCPRGLSDPHAMTLTAYILMTLLQAIRNTSAELVLDSDCIKETGETNVQNYSISLQLR